MPGHDRLRLDDDYGVGPAGPKLSQSGPEEPVQPIQTGTGPLENCDLLPQGEDLQGGVLASAEEDSDSVQESKDEFEHESHAATCMTTSTEGLRNAAASY